MEFRVTQESLVKGLKEVSGATGRIGETQNVLITAMEDGRVTFQATDSDLYLYSEAQADEVTAPGSVSLPARNLIGITGEVAKSTMVHLRKDPAGAVKVTAGGLSLKLVGGEAEFPAFPAGAGGDAVVLSCRGLASLVAKVAFAAIDEDSRIFLAGVLIKAVPSDDGVKIVAAATDGTRLAEATAHAQGDAGGTTGHLIPKRAAQQIARLLAEKPGDAAMSFSESFVHVTGGGVKIAARLLDAAFPDYERFFPGDGNVADAPLVGLRALIKRVAIVANPSNHALDLIAAKNEIKATASHVDTGEASDSLAISGSAAWEGRYNASYLLEGLAAIGEAETVRLNHSGEQKPLLIMPTNGNGFRYVLMPLMK